MIRFKVEMGSGGGSNKLIIQTIEPCPTCGRPMGKTDEKILQMEEGDDLKKLAAKITALSKEK